MDEGKMKKRKQQKGKMKKGKKKKGKKKKKKKGKQQKESSRWGRRGERGSWCSSCAEKSRKCFLLCEEEGAKTDFLCGEENEGTESQTLFSTKKKCKKKKNLRMKDEIQEHRETEKKTRATGDAGDRSCATTGV